MLNECFFDNYIYQSLNFSEIYNLSVGQLRDRFKLLARKITGINNVDVKIYDNYSRSGFGCYKIEYDIHKTKCIEINKIRYNSRYLIEKCMKETRIDSFEEIIGIPSIIYAFMHEIGHLLTMNDFSEFYEYISLNKNYIDNPYEKMANHIAYKLIVQNIELISVVLFKFDNQADIEKYLDNMKAVIPDVKFIKNMYLDCTGIPSAYGGCW